MALGVFNAKFTIVSSTLVVDYYRVVADILDQSGFFSGFDVQTNDLVYIDISSMPINNASVARYRVINIVSQDVYQVTVDIRFIDTGDTPDPNDYINQPGMIVSASSNIGMGWIASSDLQQIPAYLERYASNIDIYSQLDSVVFSGATGLQGLTGISGSSGQTGPIGVTGLSGGGGAGVTGLTPGYIPVAVTGVVALQDSYISQGRVDPEGSNTPIISYNSTPFITPPTGLTTSLLYQQYSSDFNKVVYSLSGQSLDVSAFNGFIADDLSGMTLTSDGFGGFWGMTSAGIGGYLIYMGTVAGTAGNLATFDPFRTMMFVEVGPGNPQSFNLGTANNSSDGSTFGVAVKSVNNRMSLYTYATFSNMKSQVALVKSHNTDATALGTTLDSEDLGEIRFQGITSSTPSLSTYDSRIRSVQNGAATATGVPIDLFIESSNGTTWNTNQLVVSNDNKVGVGKQPTLAKLDVSGDVAVSTVAARSTPATVFLTMETGIIRSRTAAQVLSDIGAGATGVVGVTGLTAGYIPVAVTGVVALQNSFISQGRVDVIGSNIPIISYDSTPFVTFPTGLTGHQKVIQYRSDFIESIYDIFGIPFTFRQYNCIEMNNSGQYTLLNCAGINWGSVWQESLVGLSYVGTLAGAPGDAVGYDINRMFSVVDNGPGYGLLFTCGDGYRASTPSQISANFQLGFAGSGNGPLFVIGLSSVATTENDQGTLLLGKNHNTDAYNSVSTIDTEPLGQIRFAGIQSSLPYPTTSLIDARIRAVQNGAATATGVPVDLFLEASNGSSWNTNQLVVSNDNKVGVGKQPSLAKLDVSGDVAISTVAERTTPATVFLTMETGIIKYRTVEQVRSDIGAGATGASGLPGGSATGIINVALDVSDTLSYLGEKAIINLPYNLQIDGWRLLGNTEGTLYVDVALSDYSSYPFTGPKMHPGVTGPCIIDGIKNETSDLSSWAGTTGAYGDLMRISVSSVTGMSLAYLSLRYHQI